VWKKMERGCSISTITGSDKQRAIGTGSAISTIWPALFPEMQNRLGRGARCLERTQGESSLLELHAG